MRVVEKTRREDYFLDVKLGNQDGTTDDSDEREPETVVHVDEPASSVDG